MNQKTTLVLALIAAFLVGGYVGDEMKPKPDRPVLRFLAKAARVALWFAAFSEPPPPPQYGHHPDPDHLDHGRSL